MKLFFIEDNEIVYITASLSLISHQRAVVTVINLYPIFHKQLFYIIGFFDDKDTFFFFNCVTIKAKISNHQ